MKYFLLLFISVVVFIFSSCKEDNPVPPGNQPQANLILEDASCTEAWIKLSTANMDLPAEVNLYGDSSLTETISLSSTDTLLYVDSLLPNRTYNFHTVIHPYNHTDQVTSNQLPVTTMDTTSHNFTWQTWTFGEQAGSCVLRDVAIINENDIWAVGEIYLLDTTGVPDPNAYNAVHWDGNQWELKRIRTNACGGVVYPPIQAMFSFSADDILFAHIDGSITHYNGIEFINNCSLITQLNGSANKIWGKASNDFYVVSGNGFIAHYQNGQWSRIESGTDLQFSDIYGTDDSKTGKQQILAVCTQNYPPGKGVFSLKDNIATEISSDIPAEQIAELFGIWFIPNRHYYIVGDGIYEKRILSDSIWRNGPLDITHFATTGIRGNDINDVFVAGAFGEFLHFNGITWKSYINELGSFSGSYGAVAVKNNMVITVGYQGAMAKILIGYRQ